MLVLDCLAVAAVVPDCLVDCPDSPAGHPQPQDCLAMLAPDCFAAAVARLAGGGDRLAGGGGDRSWHVCEMDTAHMVQRLRNTIYLYMGYRFLNMGLDMGLDEPGLV
jgi:hypothetical protein